MSVRGALSIRENLASARTRAVASYRRHGRPVALLAALCEAVDDALTALLEDFPLPPGAALAAVGGYGRGELYPHSDVDVLVLLGQTPDGPDRQRVEALVAALWDLGLRVSHSVRTVRECEEAAGRDITVETTLMEARWLAGDPARLRKLTEALAERRDPRVFYQAKCAELHQRHARYQDTAYALEPNCKESPGALRDLQIILWLAQACGIGRTWHELLKAGLLTCAEYRAVRRADLAFKRLRVELHLLTGRCEDRVLFDLQPALARLYGFAATRNRRASEILMQRYYWAARVVSQMNALLLQAIEERLFPAPAATVREIDEDFRVYGGRLDLRREDGFLRKPGLLLKIFLVMQRHPELHGISARTLRALWHGRRRIDAQFRRNPVHRRLFLQILQAEQGVVRALRRMNQFNLLPRYLPSFRRIVGQMQHDLFHAYTVDQHILMVVRNLRRFAMPEHAQEHPWAAALMAEFGKPWLLYIAALFHDIAKGRGGDHSELGAREALRFCRDHGLSPEDTGLVEFLVRHHLTMSLTAQKRDLADPDVILAFMHCVQDENRLTALTLLTVADIQGTSPRVWNSWKEKLLQDLYQLTLLALGDSRPDPHTLLSRRRDEAAALIRLAGLEDAARDAFWDQLDVAYFLRHDAAEIAWHTRHLHDRVRTEEPVVRARLTSARDVLQIMVYVPDRKDLFMSISRYFERRGLSVQDARIHTTRHGWALDSFIVLLRASDGEARSQATLLEHELHDWLNAPASNEAPLTHWRPASRRARVFPIVPRVELQPDAQGATWRLSLTAADRPGLLYSLALVFAQYDVDLRMAKVMTLGERVEDVFMVSGLSLADPVIQLQFERDLLAALDAQTE